MQAEQAQDQCHRAGGDGKVPKGAKYCREHGREAAEDASALRLSHEGRISTGTPAPAGRE